MQTDIKSKLIASFVALALVVGFGGVPAYAADLTIDGGASSAKTTDQEGKCIANCEDDQDSIFKIISDVLLFIIGAVSVIMLIIGGIRYTISQGDDKAVTGAKNTILYAIVGIVVALLAYAVVNFVLGSFTNAD